MKTGTTIYTKKLQQQKEQKIPHYPKQGLTTMTRRCRHLCSSSFYVENVDHLVNLGKIWNGGVLLGLFL
jgi:hypothetical protein